VVQIGSIHVYDMGSSGCDSHSVLFTLCQITVLTKRVNNSSLTLLSISYEGIQGRMLGFKLPIPFDQAGAVYMINLTTILQQGKDVSLTDIKYTTVFEGDRSFARFGWSVDLTDINQDGIKDLLFSAPFRTDDLTEEINGGTVWIC